MKFIGKKWGRHVRTSSTSALAALTKTKKICKYLERLCFALMAITVAFLIAAAIQNSLGLAVSAAASAFFAFLVGEVALGLIDEILRNK